MQVEIEEVENDRCYIEAAVDNQFCWIQSLNQDSTFGL